MYIFPLIFLVLLSFFEVSSKSHHLSSEFDADVFEDALLEHLRDVRDKEEDGEDTYYETRQDEDDDENDDEPEPDLSKTQLLKVLDIIRKETKKRHAKLMKKSIKEQHHHQQHAKKDQVPSQPTKKLDTNEKKSAIHKHELKKQTVISGNAKREKVRFDSKNEGNSQVASVDIDNSSEKEKEKLNQINLRDLLAKTGNIAVTSPPKPDRSDKKQQKVVSSKQSKAGLDQVSFIAVVAGCCVAAIAGLALAAYCWCKLRVETKEHTENPPLKRSSEKKSSKKKNKDVEEEKPMSKDEEMNVNAEYYNYQHAKNQIKQLGQQPNSGSDNIEADSSEEEDEDGDTVYECPGLAAPGDMKVVNPMFSDGESRHSDKASHDGSPTPPNERMEAISTNNNNAIP